MKQRLDKVSPLREKNIENLSKIQRLNLELQSLDEENALELKMKLKILKKSLKTIRGRYW